MRRLGYRVVDMIVDHAAGLRDKPVTRTGDPAALARLLHEEPPAQGRSADAVLDRLERDVFTSIRHLDHPRFFSFVPSASNFVSVMGDALASGFNVFSGVFLESSAAAQIELTVLDWLRALCGLPESAGGVLVSGGSVANLTALAAARKTKLGDDWQDAVLYCSDQAHSSVARAVELLGFRSDQLRRIPSDDAFRLPIDALRQAVAEDRQAGRRPFCVVANAGATNTGAVDPLAAIADLCEREELWLHVDGAYGAAAVLTPEGKAALAGMERADSLSLDPHKWLFQPFEIGCVLLRDGRLLEETFAVMPEYLKVILDSGGGVNFCDRGPQLTRGFRALKLWMSIQTFGLDAFREAVQIGLDHARFVEQTLREREGWEVVTPATLGVVTFRFRPPGVPETELNRLNLAVSRELGAGGFAMVMTTELRGQSVLRMCPINPRTTRRDIEETLLRMEQYGRGS